MSYGWRGSTVQVKQKPKLRGFDPSAVKIQHIRKLTVLYGDDKSGIAMRLARFAEVLSENGINADIVQDADSMLGILHSSGLFTPTVACVCKDGSEFVKSDKAAKARFKELSSIIDTLPNESYVIMGMPTPKSAKQMEQLTELVRRAGGVIREVSLPNETAMWLVEHAKTIGVTIDVAKATDIINSCDGNPQRAAELVDMLGDGILEMDKPSITLLSSNYGKAKRKMPNVMYPVANRNVDELVSMRRTLPAGSSGDRTFILRIASAVSELLQASLDESGTWVDATKAARWGQSYGSGRTRGIALSTGGAERYARLQSYLMARTMALYGFGDGVIATLPDLMSHIVE